MNDDIIIENLKKECKRQEESCLYTSTTLYIWLRRARFLRAVFVIVPIIFGSIASWSILKKPDITWMLWATAAAGLIAGLVPAIREALNLDIHVEEIALHAAQFKNLQDRFRIAANTANNKTGEIFESEVRDLMERLDEARKASITPPEKCFKKAQEKINKGDYDFTVDKK